MANEQEALAAYEKGRKIGQDPEFAIVDSYNLVNELVSTILLDPDRYARLGDELGPLLRQWCARRSGDRAAISGGPGPTQPCSSC